MNLSMTIRLLLTASALLLAAGGALLFAQQWLDAALLGAGALGCIAAALNFKNRTDE